MDTAAGVMLINTVPILPTCGVGVQLKTCFPNHVPLDILLNIIQHIKLSQDKKKMAASKHKNESCLSCLPACHQLLAQCLAPRTHMVHNEEGREGEEGREALLRGRCQYCPCCQSGLAGTSFQKVHSKGQLWKRPSVLATSSSPTTQDAKWVWF